MLQEEVRETEEDQEPRRRWFSDEYFDLVVWQSAGDGIVGFQFCYDKARTERAVTWRQEPRLRALPSGYWRGYAGQEHDARAGICRVTRKRAGPRSVLRSV